MAEHYRTLSAVFPLTVRTVEGRRMVLLHRPPMPEKCTGLEWFGLDRLPPDMTGIRRKALEDVLHAVSYRGILC